jgi:hypothetical protein
VIGSIFTFFEKGKKPMKSVYVVEENYHDYGDNNWLYGCEEEWEHRIVAICETSEVAWKELKKVVLDNKWRHQTDEVESWIEDVERRGLPLDMMVWPEEENENVFYPRYPEYSWTVTVHNILNEEQQKLNAEKRKKKKTKKATKKKKKSKKNVRRKSKRVVKKRKK